MSNNMADMNKVAKVIVSLGLCAARDLLMRTHKGGKVDCTKCPYYAECENANMLVGEKLKRDAGGLLVGYGGLITIMQEIDKYFSIAEMVKICKELDSGKAVASSVFDEQKNEITVVIRR